VCVCMCVCVRVCACTCVLPGGVSLLLVEVDAGHAGPWESITIEQLSKELGHIAKLVCLKTMYCAILCVQE